MVGLIKVRQFVSVKMDIGSSPERFYKSGEWVRPPASPKILKHGLRTNIVTDCRDLVIIDISFTFHSYVSIRL